MIPIFYINLQISPARRTWFEEQARSLGLKAHRIEAVNGQVLSEAHLQGLRARNLSHIKVTPGEAACFLSHRRAWETALESGHDWVFIAEDDLHLSDDCIGFFADTGWIPSGANIVKAETMFAECCRKKGHSGHHNGRILRRLLSLHIGGAGYFISRETLQEALTETSDICEVVDLVLFDPDFGLFPRWAVYQIEPAFALQDFFFETHMPGFEKSRLQSERDRTGRYGSPPPQKQKNKRKKHIAFIILRELIRPFRRLVRFLIKGLWIRLYDWLYKGFCKRLYKRLYHWHHNLIFGRVPYQEKAGKSRLYRFKKQYE